MHAPFDVSPSAPHNAASSGPITVNNVSNDDLSDLMPEVTATGGVLVRFFYTRVQIKTHNADQNGKSETRLCVAKQPKADRSTVATTFITGEEARRLYPREYHWFSQNEDAPTDGTPLAELPGITHSQVGLLVVNGLRSIEDLAELSADKAQEIGFEAIRAHKLAKAWLSRAEEATAAIDAADVEARYQQEIRARETAAEADRARIKELEIQINALRSVSGQGSANPQQSNQEQMTATRDDDDGYSHDFSEMPNPMGEGPATVDLPDPLVGV